MGDSLDNPAENDLPKSDTGNDISALTERLERLEQKLEGMEDQLTSKVISKIRLQGGGNVTVSGGNGNWTITGNPPTLNVQATAQCVDGEIVINWSAGA